MTAMQKVNQGFDAISKSTPVQLGLVVTIVGLAVFMTAKSTSLDGTMKQLLENDKKHAERLEKMEDNYDDLKETVLDIERHLGKSKYTGPSGK